jgi:hypothetical protein
VVGTPRNALSTTIPAFSKKRFINRKAGIRNFYGRPHNAFTKHVDSNFMKNAVTKSGKTCVVAVGGGFPPPQQPSITNEGKSSVQRTSNSSLCRGQDPQHARVNRKFERPKLAEHKLLDANMANVSHRFINSTDNVNIVHSNVTGISMLL